MPGKALIYGGCGALGRALVTRFRAANWVSILSIRDYSIVKQEYSTTTITIKTVVNVDLKANDEATINIVINPTTQTSEQVSQLVLSQLTPDHVLDAIVNAAGGWTGGNLQSESESFFHES